MMRRQLLHWSLQKPPLALLSFFICITFEIETLVLHELRGEVAEKVVFFGAGSMYMCERKKKKSGEKANLICCIPSRSSLFSIPPVIRIPLLICNFLHYSPSLQPLGFQFLPLLIKDQLHGLPAVPFFAPCFLLSIASSCNALLLHFSRKKFTTCFTWCSRVSDPTCHRKRIQHSVYWGRVHQPTNRQPDCTTAFD